MRKHIKILVCAFLLITITLGCCSCDDEITHGEVCEKEYRDAYTTVMMFPLIISNGKTTTTTMIPYVVHYPERYVIFIKDFDGDEWITEDFYVTKEAFDLINIGDMFEYDESRGDLQDEPYTKEKEEAK